jgi:hypothetical protein
MTFLPPFLAVRVDFFETFRGARLTVFFTAFFTFFFVAFLAAML